MLHGSSSFQIWAGVYNTELMAQKLRQVLPGIMIGRGRVGVNVRLCHAATGPARMFRIDRYMFDFPLLAL